MRVVPTTVLKRLYMRSNKAGAVQTLAHFYLLVAGAVLISETMGSWWLAPALILGGTALHQVWLFIVAPLVGAVLAAGLHLLIYPPDVPSGSTGDTAPT
jgi:glycerol uptake facilitator-like aquaporin